MPFVTEEIYGHLPQVVSGRRPASLFDARYPEVDAAWVDPGAEAAMEAFISGGGRTAVGAGGAGAGSRRDRQSGGARAGGRGGLGARRAEGRFPPALRMRATAMSRPGERPPAGAIRVRRGAGSESSARPRGLGGRRPGERPPDSQSQEGPCGDAAKAQAQAGQSRLSWPRRPTRWWPKSGAGWQRPRPCWRRCGDSTRERVGGELPLTEGTRR